MEKFSKKTYRNSKDWMDDEEAVNDWIERYRKERNSKKKKKPATEVYKSLSEDKLQELYDRYNLYDRKHRNNDTSAKYLDEVFNLGAINAYAHKRLLKSDRDRALEEAAKVLERQSAQDSKFQELKQKIQAYLSKPDKDKDPITRTDVGSLNDATPRQIRKWNKTLQQDDRLQAFKGGLLGAGIGSLYCFPIETGIAFGTRAYYKSKLDKEIAKNRLSETLYSDMVSNNQE